MISILIPLYNGIEFLQSAIDSIQQQTFKDWEILIGVNGHTNDSELVTRVRKHTSDKIKVYIHKLKDNKPKTLNKLIRVAQYDYIAVLDVDDKWLPTKLEKQVNLILENKYDVIGTQTQYFGRKHDSPDIPVGQIDNTIFKKQNPIINSSIVMKKELASWDPEFDVLDDYELWCRLAVQNYKFYNIPEILTNNRIHPNSYFSDKDTSGYLHKITKTYHKNN